METGNGAGVIPDETRDAAADPAEYAVRRMLQLVADPSQLIERERIKKLGVKLAEEQDPIQRLILISAIEEAGRVPEKEIRVAFRKYAKRYAERENIPAGAFLSMGISRRDLVDTGIVVPRKRRSGTSANSAGT